MTSSRLLGAFALANLVLCTACSTDFIVYQGTVTEGLADGYSFDASNERPGAKPIVHAKVVACVDTECGEPVYTDEFGRFPEVKSEITGLSDTTLAIVDVTTDDGRSFHYETLLSGAKDPIYGPDYDRGPAGYLHVALAP